MKKQNIVLTGFRGSGKTTFGRALARKIGLPFADLDEEIQFFLGETIESFVKKHGWQVFREVEQRVTHDFCRNFSGVLATGGGTIENSKNFQNLKKTGVFVFLNPDFRDVKAFLLKQKQPNRPRLRPELSLEQEIEKMWQERKGIYQASAEIEINQSLKVNVEKEVERFLPILKKIMPAVPPKKRVAILSSSNGTTFQGLLDAQERGRIPNVELCVFVTDQPKCAALTKAKKAKLPVKVLEAKKGENREEYDRQLMNILRENNPDFVLLVGWMRILSRLYCDQFGPISLNVHPSLLPNFPGLKGDEVHQAVLEHDERYTGATIHRVTEKVDQGEVVLQRKVPVEPEDTINTLRQKVQKQEVLGFCEFLERR